MSGIFPPLRRGSSDRHARVNKLASMMKNKGDKTTDQIIGQFCYEESVSVRVTKEYLEILILAGIVKKEE